MQQMCIWANETEIVLWQLEVETSDVELAELKQIDEEKFSSFDVRR